MYLIYRFPVGTPFTDTQNPQNYQICACTHKNPDLLRLL